MALMATDEQLINLKSLINKWALHKKSAIKVEFAS
jgi:hypothetical protein